jgi:hypothetical protein
MNRIFCAVSAGLVFAALSMSLLTVNRAIATCCDPRTCTLDLNGTVDPLPNNFFEAPLISNWCFPTGSIPNAGWAETVTSSATNVVNITYTPDAWTPNVCNDSVHITVSGQKTGSPARFTAQTTVSNGAITCVATEEINV